MFLRLAWMLLLVPALASPDVKTWPGWQKMKRAPVQSKSEMKESRENYPRMFNLKVCVCISVCVCVCVRALCKLLGTFSALRSCFHAAEFNRSECSRGGTRM